MTDREQWRVGRRNPHTVYCQHGDEPRGYEHEDHDDSLGYFRFPDDARRAVEAVNAAVAQGVHLNAPDLTAGHFDEGSSDGATSRLVPDTLDREALTRTAVAQYVSENPGVPRVTVAVARAGVDVALAALRGGGAEGDRLTRDLSAVGDTLGVRDRESVTDAAERVMGELGRAKEQGAASIGSELRNVALAVQHEANRAYAARGRSDDSAAKLTALSQRIAAHHCLQLTVLGVPADVAETALGDIAEHVGHDLTGDPGKALAGFVRALKGHAREAKLHLGHCRSICDLLWAYGHDGRIDVVGTVREALAAGATDQPDVVVGPRVRDLPVGSRFVRLDPNDVPAEGSKVRQVDGNPDRVYGEGNRYLVLYRAPEAPREPLRVGGVVETEDDLNRLPIKTMLGWSDHSGGAFKGTDGQWYAPGDSRSRSAYVIAHSGPARILDLPGDGQDTAGGERDA